MEVAAQVVPIDRKHYGNGGSPGPGSASLASSIKSLRLQRGLSQCQLAARIRIPRTYISKLECQAATPTLSSLERLARALDCTIPDILLGGERNRQAEVRELLEDRFVAEIVPFLAKLTQVQKTVILSQASDLVAEQNRKRLLR